MMPKKINKYKLQENFSVIEEPAVYYENLRTVLGGTKSVPKYICGDIDLINLSRSGVCKSALKSLSSYLGITMENMSNLLHSSHRNIQRKEDHELLDVYKTEQAIELAQLVSKGLDIFGAKENFQQWLHTNLIALGGKKPLDMLDTTIGIRVAYNILGRLEQGVYS